MMVYLQRWPRALSCGLAVPVLVLGLGLVFPGLVVAQDHSARKPLAVRSLLLDGAAVDGLMAAVGERGHILISTDSGATWSQGDVPTRRALTAVFFHDRNLGWAVGHDAAILRTRDGGTTWERLNYSPEEQRPFLDVWFSDENNGFAIGAYGFFYRTTDGGDSWTDTGLELLDDDTGEDTGDSGYDDYSYDYGADLHLNQVTAASSDRLYIAAEAGTIYRSDDGGATWISLPSPYEGSFFGALPLEGDSLLLFGLRGNLFRSEDAGESWEKLESGTQALLTDGLVLDDGTVIVVGLAGTVLVSSDGGRNFTSRQQSDRQGLTTVLPDGGGGVVLIGEFGTTRLSASEITGGAKQ